MFLISENRRPQATLAWMLVFIFAPGIGLFIYILFGRDRKAFSKQSKLLRQDLEANALPCCRRSCRARTRRSRDSRRRRQPQKADDARAAELPFRPDRRNRVEIQQDAAAFYPRMVEDMKAARHSIHLQYFIWRADAFTESLKEILIAKAKAGVEVRLLYDPLGSHAH